MADLLTWGIIIVADISLISLGIYSAYKFIKAYLDRTDLTRYRGHLINAFLLIIVVPLIVTFGGLKLADWSGGEYALIGISVQANDLRGSNNKISFSSKEFNFEPNDKRKIYLSIINEYQENKDFSIDISCTDEEEKCDKVAGLLVPNINKFNINPKIAFRLPISINIRDNIPIGRYKFNITVKDESNSTYDFIPITISVG